MKALADRQPTTARLELAEKVAELRARGLTYREVAAELGISRSYASELAADPDGLRAAARKDSYAGVCEECGARTDGSMGPGKAPSLCDVCSHQRQHDERKWTRKAVIDAIRRFVEANGRPPVSSEWIVTDFENGYPTRSAVYGPELHHPFRQWGDAIVAAGFPRPRTGARPGDTHWTAEVVVGRLRDASIDGVAPSSDTQPTLQQYAQHFFGSWVDACDAAGVKPRSHISRRTFDYDEAARRYHAGETQTQIARDLGVHKTTVSQAIARAYRDRQPEAVAA